MFQLFLEIYSPFISIYIIHLFIYSFIIFKISGEPPKEASCDPRLGSSAGQIHPAAGAVRRQGGRAGGLAAGCRIRLVLW
jgi:hypothetical protein